MRFSPAAGSFADARLKSNGARLKNCFVVPRQQLEQQPGAYFIQGCSGLGTPVADTGNAGCGGLISWKGRLYGVFGTRFFEVLPTMTDIGEIAGTGMCELSPDRTGIIILRDGRTWLYDGTTLTEYQVPDATDPEVPATISVLDGYTLYGIADSDKIYASLPLDPDNINGLNFATAEARADNNVRLLVNKLTLWVFGEETVELFYNAGQSGFPFLRYQNAMIEVGLLAKFSALSFHNAVYYIGTDRRVYRGEGLDAAPISPAWLEQIFELAGDSLKDATAVAYSHEGIDFYALTVPGYGTFEWNSTSTLWSHRTSPGSDEWCVRGWAFYGSNYYVGDVNSGRVYAIEHFATKENGEFIEYEIVTSPFGPKESRTSLHYVDVHLAALSGNPANATYQLDYTDDEGRSFKGLRVLPFPIVSQKRSIARKLGAMRRRQLRIRYEGDVPFRLEDMYISMATGWPRTGRYTPEQAGSIPNPQQQGGMNG